MKKIGIGILFAGLIAALGVVSWYLYAILRMIFTILAMG